MVLDFIFSLSLFSFFFFNSLCITFYAPSFTLVFISAFMYLSIYLSLFYNYVFIYLYVHLLLSIFFRIFMYRTFKIYFPSYNLSTCAPPPSFFFICSIFINSHMLTSPCLALLAYRFIKTLHYCLTYRRSLSLSPTFAFLASSTVFPSKRKKNLSRSKSEKKKKNRCASMRSRGSQVRPRRFSRCDCRTRYTVACCHQEFATRATCAARHSPRSSP